ncbi:putative kinase [Thermocatellispora tengchongensis]|uniref:Putative kinase n=1 Tax=Thermocatellispora tengchongensis TaxID=1073253 RepID=A0A840P6W4_9ACTN|nr:AAA family ATPase [Thermocatellispora tengchongensis]MBB5133653.1 putative kinase [Thermocatellispora tengchongensis]
MTHDDHAVAPVVLLSGPPGAGKSTVARLVADAVAPSVHLHTDDFYHAIRQGYVAPFLPESRRQNETVMKVIAACAFTYAAGGYHVVADGVVGPWFAGPFRDEAAARSIPLHYVVLLPDLDTTLARAVARGPDALTDPGPVRLMHEQFADLGPYARHALDSTGLTPARTAEAVRRGIAEGRFLLPPGAEAAPAAPPTTGPGPARPR